MTAREHVLPSLPRPPRHRRRRHGNPGRPRRQHRRTASSTRTPGPDASSCASTSTTPREGDWHALLEPAAAACAMEWDVRPAAQRCRTLILVSKFGHCLNDPLFRWQSGNLDIDIVGGGVEPRGHARAGRVVCPCPSTTSP